MVDNHGVKLVSEAESAMHDVHDMELNNPDTLSLQDCIDILNQYNQRRVFNQISDHLLHQRQHELKQCTCKDDIP